MQGARGDGLATALTYSRHSHHQTLETIAAKALAEDDAVTAFQLADRRCRIAPPPLAHCYVLRAEAAYRLGDSIGALADLAAALKILPHDTAALRRLLAWGNDSDREKAATSLIQLDQDVAILRSCIDVLRQVGRNRLATVLVYDGYVTGWAVWDSDDEAEISLSFEGDSLNQLISPDPFHALSRHPVRASSFRLRRPSSHTPQWLTISVDGEDIFKRRLPPNARPKPDTTNVRRDKRVEAHPGAQARSTIIVPVYDDFAATKACIDGLLVDNPSGMHYRVLVINDASPDSAIHEYLSSLSDSSSIELLTNDVNLGFVGSVNRALAEVPHGDVILLNADTLAPPGFVTRLAEAAASSSDIGTVVPLSNNSEISDFPIPLHNNPLGTPNEVIELDRIAASCNRDTVVDLPNGNGFCLYIKRACLDAVGGLSDSFHKGYLEDIDFCLRAREQGFRNVCAPSVYVGHAGSRSFKTEKRALVLRNLGILDYRFPRFRTETAAFAAMDPLRSARQALEHAFPLLSERPILIFAGSGALRAIAQHRARQLMHEGKSVILLDIVTNDAMRKLRFVAADERIPQSLCICCESHDDGNDLEHWLIRLGPSHCEVVDVRAFPALLIEALRSLDIPFDLWIADNALGPSEPSPENPIKTTIVSTPGDIWRLPGAEAEPSGHPNRDHVTDHQDLIATGDLLANARRLLISTPMARSFAQAKLRFYRTNFVELPFESIGDLALVDEGVDGPPTLLITPTRSSSFEFKVIRQIAHLMRQYDEEASILVAGETLDDQRLMSLENVFVTGAIEPGEVARVLQFRNVQWMLTGFDQPLFGHPMIELVRAGRPPAAYVDWSNGAILPRPGDLAIDVDASADQVAAAVSSWIKGR